jgi:DNA-binding response OmpR family regulator
MVKKKSSSTKGKRSRKQLQAGNLALDLDRRCVIKDGEAKHLTFKECALLKMFIRNDGRVLTRKRLMKEVWHTDYLGDTRTLDVHVRWLREKIEDSPSDPLLLRTVRGVGYRFEVPVDRPGKSR